MKYKPKKKDIVRVLVKGRPGTYLKEDNGSPMTVLNLNEYKRATKQGKRQLRSIDAEDCNGLMREIHVSEFYICEFK